jgi:hypothetical protein
MAAFNCMQVAVEINFSRHNAAAVIKAAMWLLWRHCLLVFGQALRPGFTEVPASSKGKEWQQPNLSASTFERKALDIHAAMAVYRLLEGAAASHLYPVA